MYSALIGYKPAELVQPCADWPAQIERAALRADLAQRQVGGQVREILVHYMSIERLSNMWYIFVPSPTTACPSCG